MIYLTVLLYIKKGKESVFKEYENAVLPILKEHNGILIHRLRPSNKNYIGVSTEEKPYEIHLISFPNDDDFKDYLQNPIRISFNDLKDESLELTHLYKGEEFK